MQVLDIVLLECMEYPTQVGVTYVSMKHADFVNTTMNLCMIEVLLYAPFAWTFVLQKLQNI